MSLCVFSGFHSSVKAFSADAIACVSVIGSILSTLIACLALLEFFNSTLQWFGLRVGLQDLSFEVRPQIQDLHF